VLGCAGSPAPPPAPAVVDVAQIPDRTPGPRVEPIPSTGAIEIHALDAANGGTYPGYFKAEEANQLRACHRRGQPFGWVLVWAELDGDQHLTKIELKDQGGGDVDALRCIVRKLRDVTCTNCPNGITAYVRLL